MGRVNWAIKDIAIGRGIASISNFRNVYGKYLYYYFKKMGKYYDQVATGTVFNSINKTNLENLEISLPVEFEDQKKIADKIAIIDRKILNNEKINANLVS